MRFRRNRRFERELSQEPGTRAALHAAAEAVKQAAETIAPKETGHYARSFVVEDGPDGPVVGNTDIAAHLIEWGSAKNAPHAPLRRGVRAAGLDLKETR